MSRNSNHINDVTITRGSDHAVGNFIQVQHARYAGSKHDLQGEGYVFDTDSLFGITTNLIGATMKDIKDDNRLAALADAYVAKLGL